MPTAGGELRRRLREAFGAEPRAFSLTARTDAGVHARENLATCWFTTAPVVGTAAALEALAQPRHDGLVAVRGWVVDPSVHARNVGLGKTYRYVIEDGCPVDTLVNPYAWEVTPRLDVRAMRAAAPALLGRHDFAAFRRAGCNAGSTVKTLSALEVTGPWPGSSPERRRIVVVVRGDAFLRKMIRIIVGTLAEIGAGFRAPEELAHILESKDRRAAGIGAPARGLTLVRIETRSETFEAARR